MTLNKRSDGRLLRLVCGGEVWCRLIAEGNGMAQEEEVVAVRMVGGERRDEQRTDQRGLLVKAKYSQSLVGVGPRWNASSSLCRPLYNHFGSAFDRLTRLRYYHLVVQFKPYALLIPTTTVHCRLLVGLVGPRIAHHHSLVDSRRSIKR